MTSIAVYSDLQADDTEAFAGFALAHGMSHEQILDAIALSGDAIPHYPYFEVTQWDQDWLQNHQSEHQAIYTVLGLTGLPDLASVDLKNDNELKTWMDLHQQVHYNINLALGL